METTDKIVALHTSYCEARGIELAINSAIERWWFEAHKSGVTPEDVKLCIKHRVRFNNQAHFKKSVLLHNLIRSDEDIAVLICEAAEERAKLRKPKFSNEKADALAATGRACEPAPLQARHISEVFKTLAKQ